MQKQLFLAKARRETVAAKQKQDITKLAPNSDEAFEREYSQRTMKTTKKRMTMLILLALVWALAFIGSAIVFKGNPIKEWIQAALFIVGMSFWLWPVLRVSQPRC